MVIRFLNYQRAAKGGLVELGVKWFELCVCVTVCWGCGGWIKCVYLYTCVLLRMLEMPWYPWGSQNKCSCSTFNNPTHTRTYTYIHTHTNSSLYQYFVLSQNIRANLIIHSRQQTDSHWEHTNRGTSLYEETMCVCGGADRHGMSLLRYEQWKTIRYCEKIP